MAATKKPNMRNRFRLVIETSEEAMGPVLAHLTRMGLENIAYELITDIKTYGSNQKRGGDASVPGRKPRAVVSSRDLILQKLDGRVEFSVREMGKVLEEHGRNKVSASPLVTVLAKEKYVKALATRGEYQVTKSGSALARETAHRLASPNPSMNGAQTAAEAAHG